MRKCIWCDKEFYPALSEVKRGYGKFCSLRCSASYINKYRVNPRPATFIEITCHFCEKKFKREPYRLKNKRPFCSLPCFYNFNRGVDRRPFKRSVKRRLFLSAFDLYGERCQICGYAISVDVHHLVPRSKGGSDDLENLVVLCPNHHREADTGLLRASDIKKIRKQVEMEGIGPSSMKDI